MGKTSADSSKEPMKIRPATTPESEETQCAALATKLSMQRLADGSASSQEIVYWLKAGSIQAQLEKERLIEENKLLRAKTATLENAEKNRVDYVQVLRALKSYRGEPIDDIIGDDYGV